MLDMRLIPSTTLDFRETLCGSAITPKSEQIRPLLAIAVACGIASEGRFSLSLAGSLRSCGLGRFGPEFIRC